MNIERLSRYLISGQGEEKKRKAARKTDATIFNLVAIVATLWLFGLAGCNGSGGSALIVRRPKPGPSTNSSIIAVDCQRQRAYVPLLALNGDLHGQIAVLDLSIDPDQGDPTIAIIDIGLVAIPRAAAVDLASGTVLVLADNVVDTGVLLLINEAGNTFTTVPLPAGSRPDEVSGVVLDPINNRALVSMVDASTCTNVIPGLPSGGCTGTAVFDLATRTFGPLSLTLIDVDAFALDPTSAVSIGTSDAFLAELLAFDLNSFGPIACQLDDDNLKNLFADPDATAADPTTGVWVVGNFESPRATVINLNGAAFTGLGTEDCHLNEGGTPPNSVNFDTGTGADGMPGVAINPVTHQALMTADSGSQIALLTLPSKPATQLDGSKVSGVSSTIPKDPNGDDFTSASFPYGTVTDSCHNLGYVIDDTRAFLAQIDLKKLEKKPSAISTALPPGTCASIATSFQCDNGKGVKFFPIPSGLSAAPGSLPAQFSDEIHRQKKSAKNRR